MSRDDYMKRVHDAFLDGLLFIAADPALQAASRPEGVDLATEIKRTAELVPVCVERLVDWELVPEHVLVPLQELQRLADSSNATDELCDALRDKARHVLATIDEPARPPAETTMVPRPVHMLDEVLRERIRALFRERGVRQAWVTTDYEGSDEACFVVDHADCGDLDIEVRDFQCPDLEAMADRIREVLPHQKIIVFGKTARDGDSWVGRIAPL